MQTDQYYLLSYYNVRYAVFILADSETTATTREAAAAGVVCKLT